jgi:hypothetical protein
LFRGCAALAVATILFLAGQAFLASNRPPQVGLKAPCTLATIPAANNKCDAAANSTASASVTSLTVGSTRTKMLRIFAG